MLIYLELVTVICPSTKIYILVIILERRTRRKCFVFRDLSLFVLLLNKPAFESSSIHDKY